MSQVESRAGAARAWARTAAVLSIALVAALAQLSVLAETAAAQARPFELRYGDNARGNVAFAANVLLECPATTPSCVVAGQSANQVPNVDNNNRVLSFVDVDGDPTTPNSSRASLSIPPSAEVLFAGLYWGGRVPADFAPSDPADVDDFLSVLLETPAGGGYQPVTGFQLDGRQTEPTWQGIADVTSLVQAGGAGEYTVADVALRQLTGGSTSNWGGWALWVAYSDPSEDWRNLSIFDGFTTVPPGQNIAVSGFVTPPSGPVDVALGSTSIEGDWASSGDQARVNGINLFDALTPVSNFFNSRITRFGVDDGDRTPNFLNQLGYDTKLIDADAVNPNIIPNGATSATLTVTSSVETYFPTVVTSAIELYTPEVTATKQVANLTRPAASAAQPGDELEYTIEVANEADDPVDPVDAAEGVVLSDSIPTGTTYVPDSLEMVSGDPAPPGQRTDVGGDDSAEYDGGSDEVTFRLGNGANAASGGTLAPGATATVRFRVRIDAAFPSGDSVTNAADVNLFAPTIAEPAEEESNEVETQVVDPPPADLAIAKRADPSPARAGDPLTYTLEVTNNGPGATPSATVTDNLPAGLTYVTDDAGCDTSALPALTCTLDALGSGEGETIEIVTEVNESTTDDLVNSAMVSGPIDDPDPDNNDDSTRTRVEPRSPSPTPTESADLRLTKAASEGRVGPRERITYRFEVTNNGPDASPSATVTDRLPSKLAYVSDTAGCDGGSGRTITCEVGPLAAGRTLAFEVVTRARRGTGGSARNSASVTGPLSDPKLNNNDSKAAVRIGQPKLRISKRADAELAHPGGVVSYRITVRNKGSAAARRVKVCDRVPSDQTLLRVPGGKRRGDRACWRLERLGPGKKRVFRVTTRIHFDSPTGWQKNTATVRAANGAGRRADTANVHIAPMFGACRTFLLRC